MQDNTDSPIIFYGSGFLFHQAIPQGDVLTLFEYFSLGEKSTHSQ